MGAGAVPQQAAKGGIECMCIMLTCRRCDQLVLEKGERRTARFCPLACWMCLQGAAAAALVETAGGVASPGPSGSLQVPLLLNASGDDAVRYRILLVQRPLLQGRMMGAGRFAVRHTAARAAAGCAGG